MNASLRSPVLMAFGLMTFSGSAQLGTRTLFPDSLAVGGFADMTMRYTNVLSTDAFLLGFSFGALVEEKWRIGIAGAFSTSVIKNPEYEEYLNDSNSVVTNGGLELGYGYGGLLVEPVLFHRSLVHLSLPVLVGVGGANYKFPIPNGSGNQRNRVSGQAFFALETGLDVEVNILRSFRIGVGGCYLFTSDLSLPMTEPDALRTFMARFSFKFSWD